MPHYEFFCHACKKTFSSILTIAEHDKEKVTCPHCGSKERRAALVRVFRDNREKERIRPYSEVRHGSRQS